jgi:hypothetical protein
MDDTDRSLRLTGADFERLAEAQSRELLRRLERARELGVSPYFNIWSPALDA